MSNNCEKKINLIDDKQAKIVFDKQLAKARKNALEMRTSGSMQKTPRRTRKVQVAYSTSAQQKSREPTKNFTLKI